MSGHANGDASKAADANGAVVVKAIDEEKGTDLSTPQKEVALDKRGLTALPDGFVKTQAATLKKLDLTENKIS
jgi:hypothetical protein